MAKWKGCIVEESLDDNRVLNDIDVLKIRITTEKRPEKRWHIYNSVLSEREINRIHRHLKKGWYMHFWKGAKMIVLFKGRRFVIKKKR
ncbi:MAG: hypothetical protein KGH94_04910 [Candidatus Micrarchaeota archaeon]|nr:hypothetical protein [Candidatus Micrarchaeota archaeon]